MPTNLWQGRWQGCVPAGDNHQRARKIISPSGGIIRGKFPSRKNGRMVHYEGLLELDAIYLFETSPQIVRYREQPQKIHYPDGPKLRRYTPDFELVLTRGNRILIEVKPTRSLKDKKIRHALDCIHDHMARSNMPFVILSEKTIRQEPRLANLRVIYHGAARIPPTSDASRIALSKCGALFPAPIRTAAALLAERGIEPYSLLLAGLLRCPLSSPLTLDTPITYASEADHGWFWIAEEYGF